jgi:hypothetical protein
MTILLTIPDDVAPKLDAFAANVIQERIAANKPIGTISRTSVARHLLLKAIGQQEVGRENGMRVAVASVKTKRATKW